MASILTAAYAEGTKFYLPNMTEGEIETSVLRFIETMEGEFLSALLGYELAKDFLANVVFSTPTVPATATPPYDVLLNGGEFTDCNGRLNVWNGFLGYEAADGKYENSQIWNYVYYNFMEQNAEIVGGVGAYHGEISEGVRTSPRRLMSRAWNEMVEWNISFHNFMLDQGETDFPSYVGFANGFTCCDRGGRNLFETRSQAGF